MLWKIEVEQWPAQGQPRTITRNVLSMTGYNVHGYHGYVGGYFGIWKGEFLDVLFECPADANGVELEKVVLGLQLSMCHEQLEEGWDDPPEEAAVVFDTMLREEIEKLQTKLDILGAGD